jgi:hypothetical protein
MMPLQPDGITRSNSVVRWQFYCSDESRYETHNLSASGLLHVIARWVKLLFFLREPIVQLIAFMWSCIQ